MRIAAGLARHQACMSHNRMPENRPDNRTAMASLWRGRAAAKRPRRSDAKGRLRLAPSVGKCCWKPHDSNKMGLFDSWESRFNGCRVDIGCDED